MPELPEILPGDPFYGPLDPATLADGWCYGYITEAPCEDHPDGCESGDGYVVAPDGSYAGLIWWEDCPWECQEEKRRFRGLDDDDVENKKALKQRQFGVFEVRFPRAIRSLEDLTWNFRRILPESQRMHAL